MNANIVKASDTNVEDMSACPPNATRDRSIGMAAPVSDPFAPLLGALDQLADLVEAAADAQYVQKPVGVIDSSLGGHIRHCLDHFETFCTGAETAAFDYDRRLRGTTVETDRGAALAAIRDLQDRVASLDSAVLSRRARIRSMLAGDGTSIETMSSIGRELVFVLSHTIHHCALVAAMCRTLGVPVAERFGYAPATIAHLNRTSCAPLRSSH